jgi:hypothetical protein
MPVPVKNVKEIRIDLYWEDQYGKGTKNFFSVQELADFLKDNPLLAEAVGYVPKKKK